MALTLALPSAGAGTPRILPLPTAVFVLIAVVAGMPSIGGDAITGVNAHLLAIWRLPFACLYPGW